MADFQIVGKIIADASQFAKGIGQAKDSLASLPKQTGNIAEKIGKTFTSAGAALTKGLTVPLAGIGAASLKAYSDYDTALKGVAKTTGLSGKALKSFSGEILNMSREVPIAATELAGIAEAAGQLGIKNSNLTGFTKVMAQLGTATNMSSEQAATSLARLANITQMPQDNFEKLGSTVVALGNNFATTESEIVEMSTRLAAAGSQVGLSEHQILAMSTALSSVGVNAEAGGSAMSRVMQKMNTEVLSGGKNLEGFAKVSGQSAEEFAKAWRDSPDKAITSFVKGLGKIKDSGGDATQTLKDLGITSVQELNSLLALAGAGDLLSDSFNKAGEAWEDNTALSEEAETAYQSFANQLKLLGNALREAGIAIGGVLAPYISKLTDKVKQAVTWFNNLDEGTQKNIVKFGLIAAAIGPVLLILGKFAGSISKVVGLFKLFGGASKAATAGTKGFGNGLSFIGPGKILAIAAAIAIVVAAFTLLATQGEGVKAILEGLGNAIANIATAIGGVLVGVITAAGEAISTVFQGIGIGIATIIEAMGPNVQTIADMFVRLAEVVGQTIVGVTQAIAPFIPAITEMVTAVVSQLPLIIDAFSGLVSAVGGAIANIIVALQPIVQAVTTMVAQIVAQLPRIITAFAGLVTAIGGAVANIITAIQPIVTTVADMVVQVVAQLPAIITAFSGLAESIGSAISGIIDSITGLLSAVEPIIQAFGDLFVKLGEGIKTALDGVTGVLEGFAEVIRAPFEGAQKVIEAFGKAVEGILTRVKEVIAEIGETAGKLADAFGQVTDSIAGLQGVDLLGIGLGLLKVGQGIKEIANAGLETVASGLNSIGTALGGIFRVSALAADFQALKSAFSGFPSLDGIASGLSGIGSALGGIFRVSALATDFTALKTSLTGLDSVANTASAGLKEVGSSAKTLASAMTSLKSQFTQALNSMKSTATSVLNSIKSTFTSSMNAMKSTVISGMNGIKSSFSSGFQAINSTVSSSMSRVQSTVTSTMSSVVSAMNSAAGQARSAGYNMGMGFYNGLSAMSGSIIGLAMSIASRAASAMRSALRIHSPSRVTASIGNYTGQGFVDGLKSMVKPSERMATKLANAGIPVIDSGSITDQINSLTAKNLNHQYQFSGGELVANNQPAEITLHLGNTVMKAFVDDIMAVHEQRLDMSLNY